MTFKALGVYIFAGGFTLGVRKHFDVQAHFEDGPFGTATVRHNMPDIPIYTNPDDWPADQYAGIDLLYGNPPCAPWSAAGTAPRQKERLAAQGVSHRWEVDARVECVRKQFALLERLRPTFWVWESVERAYSVGADFVKALTERANAIGYQVTWLRVDGRWTGLPQRRKRFFMVIHRVAFKPKHPGKQPLTVREAWAGMLHPGDVPRHSPKYVEIYKEMQEGEGAQEAWERKRQREGRDYEFNDRGQIKGRPGFLNHRLIHDSFSPTIVNGQSLVHPVEHRPLTVLETQLLSGYPANYVFKCRMGEAYAEISKAVLPPVGEWLAGEIRTALEANEPFDPNVPVQDIDYRKPPQFAT